MWVLKDKISSLYFKKSRTSYGGDFGKLTPDLNKARVYTQRGHAIQGKSSFVYLKVLDGIDCPQRNDPMSFFVDPRSGTVRVDLEPIEVKLIEV